MLRLGASEQGGSHKKGIRMTSTKPIEVLMEAQGAKPNFRYDIIQPLVGGRVPIDGVSLTFTGVDDTAGMFENPKFKNGEFGLLDTNIGDILPAIDEGWDFVVLPVMIKHKAVYNYLWVRADRGIESPKDLEGKLFATAIWGVVTTYTRGLLQRFTSPSSVGSRTSMARGSCTSLWTSSTGRMARRSGSGC